MEEHPTDFIASREGKADFIASREGETAFFGTILSIGKERPYDGRPIKFVMDDGEKAVRLTRLEDQFKEAVKLLDTAAVDAGLPLVVAVANHDPQWRFDDLPALLEDTSAKSLLSVDLFIWFDDFRNDRMLFCRTDPAAYEALFNWFHVDQSL
jgi:hypothetical protein